MSPVNWKELCLTYRILESTRVVSSEPISGCYRGSGDTFALSDIIGDHQKFSYIKLIPMDAYHIRN